MNRLAVLLAAACSLSAAHAQLAPHPLSGPIPAVEHARGCDSPIEVPRGSEVDVGYANIFYFTQARHAFSTIATDDPGNPTDVVSIPASAPAGAFVPEGERGIPGAFYELTWPDRGGNHTLRRRGYDGSVTNVGIANPADGAGWSDMAFHPLTGLLYALATNCEGLNYLYLIDPLTANLTLLATLTAAACLISMAIALDGYLYALDVGTDQLFRISLATFAMVALAHGIGYTTGFAQGMAYSAVLGLIVLATVNTFGVRDEALPTARGGGCERGQTLEGELRLADVDDNGDLTGTTTFLGRISPTGHAEALYYAFPLDPSVGVDPAASGSRYDLSAVYPNPLGAESVLLLHLAVSEHVSLTVYDLLGRVVAQTSYGLLAGGQPHRLTLGTANLTSGAYLIHVRGESFEATRRAVVQ